MLVKGPSSGNWLPETDCCKNFTYDFELERVKTISKRALQHQKHIDSYVNPIVRAKEFEAMLKELGLTQNQLAYKLGISRVRVTQILNLLKLPQEQQDYIIAQGKEKQITERSIRHNLTQFQPSGEKSQT